MDADRLQRGGAEDGKLGLNQEVPFLPMLLTLRRAVAGSPCLGIAQLSGLGSMACNVKPGLDEKWCGARSNERLTLTCDVNRQAEEPNTGP